MTWWQIGAKCLVQWKNMLAKRELARPKGLKADMLNAWWCLCPEGYSPNIHVVYVYEYSFIVMCKPFANMFVVLSYSSFFQQGIIIYEAMCVWCKWHCKLKLETRSTWTLPSLCDISRYIIICCIVYVVWFDFIVWACNPRGCSLPPCLC